MRQFWILSTSYSIRRSQICPITPVTWKTALGKKAGFWYINSNFVKNKTKFIGLRGTLSVTLFPAHHHQKSGSTQIHWSPPVTFLSQIYQVPKTLWNWLCKLEILMLDHHLSYLSAYFEGKFNFHDSFWDKFQISATKGRNLTET